MEEMSRSSETARMGQQVAEKANEAESEIRRKADQAMEAGRNMAASAKQMAKEGVSQMQDAASQVQDAASEYYRQGRDTAETVWKTLKDQTEQRPFAALLIAAAFGLLLGAFFTRRR